MSFPYVIMQSLFAVWCTIYSRPGPIKKALATQPCPRSESISQTPNHELYFCYVPLPLPAVAYNPSGPRNGTPLKETSQPWPPQSKP